MCLRYLQNLQLVLDNYEKEFKMLYWVKTFVLPSLSENYYVEHIQGIRSLYYVHAAEVTLHVKCALSPKSSSLHPQYCLAL